MFSVLVIRLISLILLIVSGIVMLLLMFLLLITVLNSFPTRRSSDLQRDVNQAAGEVVRARPLSAVVDLAHERTGLEVNNRDRKSTRLNSSHQIISYAVFCLKKKNVSPAYHLLEGFPFIQEPPSCDFQ